MRGPLLKQGKNGQITAIRKAFQRNDDFLQLVNIICFAILWMETAKQVGCSAAWGIMTLVPFINFIALGVMAFSSGGRSGYYPPTPPAQPKTRQPQNVG